MPARKPFTDRDIHEFKKALDRCKEYRRELDRAERVGVGVERYRERLDAAERQIQNVIYEYGDDSLP